MGFVVYEKDGGHAVRYYERESVAKAQVTKNNKHYVMEVLKSLTYRHYCEYAYCSWADFETVVKESYSKQMSTFHRF
jgi:hypothetical protein